MIANVLSIAGSDPSGGAGIQADIKSISANGAYAMTALTALTAQNTQGVRAVSLVDPVFVTQQIAAVLDDIRVDAVKIGMLGSADIVRAVVAALEGCRAPIVLDTVMVAKSGDRLLHAEAVEALRDQLLPMATVITPNLPEAGDLLGAPEVEDEDGMTRQADALRAIGAQAVLLKGGHLRGEFCRDLLHTGHSGHWLDGERIRTRNTHGTGCTLSSALAAQLGQGLPLPDAAQRAKTYVAGAIRSADALSVGTREGHGPLHHFHAHGNL